MDFDIMGFAKNVLGNVQKESQNAATTSYVSQFKSLLNDTDDAFSPANRNHFFVFFTFPSGINQLFPDEQQRKMINHAGYLVRSFNAPNFTVTKESLSVESPLGAQSIIDNGTFAPAGREFSLDFLDCELPICEKVFVPWMKSTLNPRRTTTGEDAFKANVYINVYANDGHTVKYALKINGVYPNFVNTPDFKYGDDDIKTRAVGFKCNEVDVMWDGFIKPDAPKSKKDGGIFGTLDKYLDLKNIM